MLSVENVWMILATELVLSDMTAVETDCNYNTFLPYRADTVNFLSML